MTPEEIFEKSIKHNMFEDPFNFKKDIIKAMKQFGKQCFEAALENKKLYNPEKNGSLTMITIIPEYKTYEDYLKCLEND